MFPSAFLLFGLTEPSDSVIGLKNIHPDWLQELINTEHTENIEKQVMRHLVHMLSAISGIPVLLNTDWSQIFVNPV